ncbi:SWIM zinc finger family protein [Aureispira]|nr:SWIM zinc finger family protein [Aureispira sp.]
MELLKNLSQDFLNFTKDTKNRIENIQSDLETFSNRLQEICDSFDSNIVKINNYNVDTTNNTCSCPHFHYRLQGTGRLCKHLKQAFNELQSNSRAGSDRLNAASTLISTATQTTENPPSDPVSRAQGLVKSNVVKVHGSNGNVYEVDLDNFKCTCPHFQYRLKNCNTPCKHMEKVANQHTAPQLPPRTQ